MMFLRFFVFLFLSLTSFFPVAYGKSITLTSPQSKSLQAKKTIQKKKASFATMRELKRKAFVAKKEQERKVAFAKKNQRLKALAAKKKQPARIASIQKNDPLKASATANKQPASIASVQKNQPLKASAAANKQPTSAASIQKNEPLKASATTNKQPTSAASIQKNEPLKASATTNKQPENAVVLKKDQPLKASATTNEQPASIASIQKNQPLKESATTNKQPENAVVLKKDQQLKTSATTNKQPESAAATKKLPQEIIKEKSTPKEEGNKLFDGLNYFSFLNSQSQTNAKIGELDHLLSQNFHGQSQTVAVIEQGGTWGALKTAINNPSGILPDKVRENYKLNFLPAATGANRDPHSKQLDYGYKWGNNHGSLTSSVVLDYAPQAKVLPVSTYLSYFDTPTNVKEDYSLAEALVDLSRKKDVTIINISGSAVPAELEAIIQGDNLNGTPKYGYKMTIPKKLTDAFKMVAKSGKAIVIATFNDGEELHSPTILETPRFDAHAYFSHLFDNLDEETKQSIILAGNLHPDTGKAAVSSNRPGKRKEFQDRFLFAPAGKLQVSFDGDVIDGGTSSAAPYICAALANLLSKSEKITPKKAIKALLDSADKEQDRATYGQGIIRAGRAHKLLEDMD